MNFPPFALLAPNSSLSCILFPAMPLPADFAQHVKHGRHRAHCRRNRASQSRDCKGASTQSMVDSVTVGYQVDNTPMAYLITFTCYGARLHGNASGSVDRKHNVYGSPFVAPNPIRIASEERRTKQAPYSLNSVQRAVVLRAVMELCSHRGWSLLAIHVRTQHAHLVVAAEASPEKILEDAKKYASRALNRLVKDGESQRRWARHGSTRYLWKPESVGAAIHYVVREQGEPMAVWEKPETLG